MRKFILLVIVAGMALPALAAKRVTVEQLEKVLAEARGKTDVKVAQQLSDLELSERLSAATLSRWSAALPGAQSRQALVVLADVSAFLDPPAAEIPDAAKPDVAAQRQMLALAVDYASKTIHQLPNFLATRNTVRFENTPAAYQRGGIMNLYQPLHPVDRSSGTVVYRDGKEVVDSEVVEASKKEASAQGLVTRGVFGPMLAMVLIDASRGKLAWSHWEQGTAGPRAVFHYEVPQDKSQYQVDYCCVPIGRYLGVFKKFSGYHGEIALDPANGAILRMTLEADLKDQPVLKSDILVEYGPVTIEGKSYVCPLRNISVSAAPSPGSQDLQMLLNDAVFGQYHLFRAETRVLASGDTLQGGPVASAGSGGARMPTEAAKPEEVAPEASEALSAPPLGTAAVASPPLDATAAPPANPAPAPAPAIPEASVTPAQGLPEGPAVPPSPATGLTLHASSRLVDLGVVAFDKKGRRVADLKPEDFEIYDNGRKQAVRSFNRANSGPAKEIAAALGQQVFSNRSAAIADASPGSAAAENHVTILLLDAGNLGWNDLTYARGEMLRFLRSLPADEHVGLYVMKGYGFQVIEEGTTDHALLAAKLSKWMPNAQDLARAQDEETRNRQQFDYVDNESDLQYVNGNLGSAPESYHAIDPKLRSNDANPARDGMAVLVGVARHLASVPGHKNLVWVSSDNVLADWTDQAAGHDKGNKQIEAFVLQAQEAVNEAHVSIYPLDASQLETMAVDASLRAASVEVHPGAVSMPETANPAPAGMSGPGRVVANMRADTRPIQIAVQDMAAATGGRTFRRSGEIAANLNEVVSDGRASYLLGFSPDVPADDQYHVLTVKLVARPGVTLRYRTGYLYAKEPATPKDRFRQAVWQATDVNEIGVSANPVAGANGTSLALNIATNDLALKQQDDRWTDKLDVFLVQRDEAGLRAQISGKTVKLALKSETYQDDLAQGISFEQPVEQKPNAGSVRVVVVDENSGRMGSVTIPADVLQTKPPTGAKKGANN